jgi:lipopolysaccharide biosynthesis protein
MKILAFNLPQYHSIPENDQWWGKGFTEWTNLKRAKPLFKGHEQPKIPINGYYYDLSKKEDIIHQIDLAKEYGISGFVYYHYWFNGKLLLEKPCEILKESSEVDFNYCFCWANEQWTRTWDGKPGQVIMPQSFGGLEDWKRHLDYLLPFFKDTRYIIRDNKPLLFIYSASRIPHFDEMIEYWNKEIRSYGFDGIYIIEFISTVNPNASSKHSEAVIEYEPMYSNRFGISNIMKLKRLICKKLHITDYLNYDRIWNSLLKRNRIYGDREILHGAFVGFDNSPRKGKAGLVLKYASPSKFEKYLRSLVNVKRINGSKEYIVINAWNEWGEGAILEPSEQDGYSYLNAVKRVAHELES